MPRYMLNSLLITVPTVIGAVALSCMAGFALGIYKFKGSNLWIFFMFVAGNFVPFQILMVPVRDLTLNWTSTTPKLVWCCFTSRSRPGSARCSCATSSSALPFALIEAARVEGVAEWKIFVYIVLPLMKPAHCRIGVLIFTFIWNDYFWAVVLTQGARSQPVTAGITSFNAQFRAAYHLMSAGARSWQPCRRWRCSS